MPIQKQWSPLNKSNAEQEPDETGYYQLADENENIVYIGEGKLQEQLLAHLPKGNDPMRDAVFYKAQQTGDRHEAEKQENILLKEYIAAHGGLPYYNEQKMV